MKLKDLKFDKRNYRKHDEKNKKLIKKSIAEVGYGRSIVVDNENEVICGNGVLSQTDAKTPIKVVETDGSELIVVKRTDLNTDDDRRKQLAVMDNSTSDSSDFDLALLQEDFGVDELADFGVYNIPSEFTVDMPTASLPAGKATVEEIVENLPEELKNTKLEPEALEEIITSYKTARERVIITFPEDKSDELAKILGVEKVDKVIYTLEELIGEAK